eukprot:TRINITY_DN4159_c0_g3_i4.p1 TRINITY_DN4159_c0_g3~~TRINITY_DN4159_c0_g3_i4.p1  ORF type:complete len:277 (-),score=96.64 TRINITY_DN4159_c0_g3_i4:99-929(-)
MLTLRRVLTNSFRARHFSVLKVKLETGEESDVKYSYDLLREDAETKDEPYQDWCFKWERERSKFYDMHERGSPSNKEEFAQIRQQRVDYLIGEFQQLTSTEWDYFFEIFPDRLSKADSFKIDRVRKSWASELEKGDIFQNKPDYAKKQEALSKFLFLGFDGVKQLLETLDLQKHFPEEAIAQVVVGQAPVEEEKKEVKAEEKKEVKTIFDVELSGVDAAQKIKAIKEVRQLFNLGLKEAKDLIESAPKIIKKDVKKEEAEKIRDVLVASGCIINFL